jgi:hypothetical protein
MISTKTFFVQLIACVANLKDMFPEDADFPTFLTFLGLLQKTNPSMVVNTFYESVVVPFEKQIDSKDEAFLMSYGAEEYGSEVSGFMVKVKEYWSVLDVQTKDSLWQYFYILKELSKRAYNNAD